MDFGFTLKPDNDLVRSVELTKRAEANGFTYGWIFDSHVIWREPYVALTLMAQATTGMQDPVTLTLFGAGAHYAQGVAFALIYAFGIHPLLPIANTFAGNFAKALIWGLVLATLSSVWWINLFSNLAGPGVNAGFFFSNFGPDQLKWVLAVYLWHLVYGFHLGAFYQPNVPKPMEVTSA